MPKKLTQSVDTNLKSPDEYVVDASKQFWKSTLTNNDFLKMYRRKGVAFRTINKQISLMFKHGWTSDDATGVQIAETFTFDDYAKYAYQCALISGWSLIYKEYGDSDDYSSEAPANARASGYYVIPRAWVYEDRYTNQEVRDYYTLYRADGGTFTVHESRLIRVKANKDGISVLESAYDSLTVLDNVMWGIGQTMFRSGSGFPVLKIDKSQDIINVNGTKMTRTQYYKKIGFLTDLNSQTGFMIDNRDDFNFAGAAGKAIAPGEYYDRAFQQCAVDLDVPVDILKGVSAGAVTGSETNLKEYYGDLASKQEMNLSPIYDELFASQQYVLTDYMKWYPIFEETQKEIDDSLTKTVEAIHKLEMYGYYSHEQAVNFFADSYENLNYDKSKLGQLITLPTYVQQTPSQPQAPVDSVCHHDESSSALPTTMLSVEKKYEREMMKAYGDTGKNVARLLEGFNTDAKTP
jgi:hypothetical protein